MRASALAVLLGAGLALSQAQASDSFAALEGVDAAPLGAAELAAVSGRAHVYLKIEAMGIELPARAEEATRAAAPGNRNFTPNPSRDARAFVRALGER